MLPLMLGMAALGLAAASDRSEGGDREEEYEPALLLVLQVRPQGDSMAMMRSLDLEEAYFTFVLLNEQDIRDISDWFDFLEARGDDINHVHLIRNAHVRPVGEWDEDLEELRYQDSGDVERAHRRMVSVIQPRSKGAAAHLALDSEALQLRKVFDKAPGDMAAIVLSPGRFRRVWLQWDDDGSHAETHMFDWHSVLELWKKILDGTVPALMVKKGSL
jgi:hypothetical protein